jgi:hypothetical protein
MSRQDNLSPRDFNDKKLDRFQYFPIGLHKIFSLNRGIENLFFIFQQNIKGETPPVSQSSHLARLLISFFTNEESRRSNALQ